MKLVDFTCPGCGAKLQINESLSQATCNYCGHVIYLQNDILHQDACKIGYEFERGRMEAQSTINTVLLSSIQKIRPVIMNLKSLYENDIDISQRIDQLKDKLSQAGNPVKRIILLSCMFSIVTIALLLVTRNPATRIILWGIIMATIGAIIGAISLLPYKLDSIKLSRLQTKQDKINETKKRVIAELSPEEIELIPQIYWNDDALDFIYSSLKNKRAMSIQQAINLYEDEMYRHKQMQLQQETIRKQKDSIELEKERLRQQQFKMKQDQENMKELGKDILKGAAVLGASAIVKGMINRKR